MARKKSEPKVDGFSPKDAERVRQAVRKVWSWSHAHRLVILRCALPGGYARCEECKKKVPRVYVDHIDRVGLVDEGFIARMFVASNRMQGLCKPCHDPKTAWERKLRLLI